MTAENTSGNLDRKIILTFPFDPWIPAANKTVLEAPPENKTSGTIMVQLLWMSIIVWLHRNIGRILLMNI